MGKLEKEIERLKSKPKDFTYKVYQIKEIIEILKKGGMI